MKIIQSETPSRGYRPCNEGDSLPKGFQIIQTQDEFDAIGDPANELVIWQRSLPRKFRTWLDQLDAPQLPNLRLLIKPTELRNAMEPHLIELGMSNEEMRDLLVEDIEGLVLIYASITKSKFVDIRLERISDDSCWKFHRDFVETRLITTYRGPATEWVQPQHSKSAIDEQERFMGPVEQLQNNDVAIFKGNGANTGTGIVHRSPPIEGTEYTRLLLCLNQRSEVSPHLWQE